MRYQPGYGYIPESGQELAGLKKFLKRLTVKLVKLDPLSKAVFMPKQDAVAVEAAAAPIPEMPTGLQEPAAPVAPLVTPAPTAAGPTYFSEPLPDPLEETEGPPQPIQAGLFSGGLSVPLLMAASLVGWFLFGQPPKPSRSGVRRRSVRRSGARRRRR
jgi:hypothetical protein